MPAATKPSSADLRSRWLIDSASPVVLCHAGAWDAAEGKHKKVCAVRRLFQDYAPIPAQKALLARQLGEPSWNNLRPPMQPMATDKLNALADALYKEFGMKF